MTSGVTIGKHLAASEAGDCDDYDAVEHKSHYSREPTIVFYTSKHFCSVRYIVYNGASEIKPYIINYEGFG